MRTVCREWQEAEDILGQPGIGLLLLRGPGVADCSLFGRVYVEEINASQVQSDVHLGQTSYLALMGFLSCARTTTFFGADFSLLIIGSSI